VLKLGGKLVVVVREPLPSSPPKPRKDADGASGAKAKVPPKAKAKAKAPPKAKAPADDPAAHQSEHETLRQDLARAYAGRPELSGVVGEDQLLERIAVIDANDIVQYLRARRPIELPDEVLEKLGVRRSGELLNHDGWIAEHQAGRGWPRFESDATRERFVVQLKAHLQASGGSVASTPLVIVGPPGVGKTRLVMEAITRAGVEARVAIAEEVEEVLKEISDQNLLRSAPSMVLVVDDCPIHKVDLVLRRFSRAQRDESPALAARLVVIVPHGEVMRPGEINELHELLLLQPLATDARLALIRQELDDGREVAVDASTGGYPWLAILVAREVRDGAATPKTPTDAARLALVSRAEQGDGRGPVRRRARALLAVMLANNPHWDALSDPEKEALALAVDFRDRKELVDELDACLRRGVLRSQRRWYITPGILEREVWKIATESPDPGGPLLPRIKAHCPEKVADFLACLEALKVDTASLGFAAAPLARDLAGRLRSLDDLTLPAVAASLTFCARHAPELVVDAVAALIDHSTSEQLEQRLDVRRPLVYALIALMRAPRLFTQVEGALFRLRVAENEGFANNASAVWAWLFLPAIDLTDASYEERFATLSRRCRVGFPEERLSAIDGLAALLHPFGLVFLEGGVPPRSVPGAGARFQACWGLLVSLASDEDPRIGEHVQEELVKNLRAGIGRGLLDAHADALVGAVRGFGESARVALRGELDAEQSLRGRDEAQLNPLWRRLDEASRASDFHQRLRDQLCARRVYADEAESASLDEALLAEGLRPESFPILQSLDEFERPDAHRAAPMMIAAGRLDDREVLLDPLIARARERRDGQMVSLWACGRWDRGDEATVRGLVDKWSEDPALLSAVVETMARIGLNDSWLTSLTALVRGGRLDEQAMRRLEHASWRDTSPALRQQLMESLLDCGEPAALRVVLTHYDREKRDLEPYDLALIERVLGVAATQVFTGHVAWSFYQCGLHLLDAGRTKVACEAAVAASCHESLPGDSVWQLVEVCARRAPQEFWEVLSGWLSGQGPEAGRLFVRLSFHDVVSPLPPDAVMSWIGTEDRRGRLISTILFFVDETLPSLARALLRRFGSSSSVARALAARFVSTTRPVRSLATFYGERCALALRWTSDSEVVVSEWARAVADDLWQRQKAEAEDEALEQRRFGT
jgi:hypothetical protein